jgi:hypothetical protein
MSERFMVFWLGWGTGVLGMNAGLQIGRGGYSIGAALFVATALVASLGIRLARASHVQG